MVQKVVLGKRPPFLRREIPLVMPDGEPGAIRVDFAYRTRREFADFVDSLIKAANEELQKAAAPAPEAAPVKPAKPRRGAKATPVAADVQTPAPVYTERKSVDEAIGATSQQLLDIMVGWNLDVPLSLAALDQLCDEFPGAANAISTGYRRAVNEGHSGN